VVLEAYGSINARCKYSKTCTNTNFLDCIVCVYYTICHIVAAKHSKEMPPQAPEGFAGVKEGKREESERARQLVCLQEDIIGNYDKFSGPFGDRPIIYADWTASGRCIHSIENFMANSVLPLYGNTHTEVSVSGHQTGHFRNEARDIISKAMNATDLDAVIFTGNGTTGGFLKLIQSLRLEVTGPPLFGKAHIPVVFTSSYEHHSNILNW
jgi:hypothetical protein